MTAARLFMLLAALACLMSAVFVRADASDDAFDASANPVTTEEEEEEDIVEDLSEGKEKETQYIDARAIFAGHESEAVFKFPAGERVTTFVSFQNKLGGNPAELFIVAAHLSPLGNPNAFVQNFSAVRTSRTVNGGETATIKYDFRPDAMLEPMDYNLAVRVFFLSEENATFVAAAFNSTITIIDPLGVDFKGITAYLILAALIGGAVYFFAGKSETVTAAAAAATKKTSGSSATAKKAPTDAIVDEKGINKEYISPEHLKYREQLLKAAEKAASPKKKTSSSPKKK